MKTTHTPGPWKADSTVTDYDATGAIDGGLYGFQVSASDGRRGIAIVEWHGKEFDSEDRANKRIVAKAPEMFEALTALEDFHGEHNTLRRGGRSIDLRKVRALLATIAGCTSAEYPDSRDQHCPVHPTLTAIGGAK